MDEVIFQEFKGTGNMELVLDRKLADRRIFPAIDIAQSGTRKEERLFSPEEFPQVTLLRRSLMELNPQQAMESLVQQLAKYENNAAFLAKVNTFVNDIAACGLLASSARRAWNRNGKESPCNARSILLKPDCVQRRLVGTLIQRFEQKGLRLVGLKFVQASRELAEKHYAVHKGKPFYDSLLSFLTSGPDGRDRLGRPRSRRRRCAT